jgi:hypothetical protein
MRMSGTISLAQNQPGSNLKKPRQVADELGISPKTLMAHVRAGNISYVLTGLGKVRKHIGFRQSDVDGFLERQAHLETGRAECLFTKVRESVLAIRIRGCRCTISRLNARSG